LQASLSFDAGPASDMKFVEDCPECQRLSAQYEAATLDCFRAQNEIGIAEYFRKRDSIIRSVEELRAILKRRQSLRDQAEEHLAREHAVQRSPLRRLSAFSR